MPPPPHPAPRPPPRPSSPSTPTPPPGGCCVEVARLYHEGFPGAPRGVVPLSAVYAAMAWAKAAPPSLPDFTPLGGLLQALGLWRLAKGAYLFHPHLAREVAGTPLGRLPVELLLRLPEPAPLLLLPEGLPSWPELRGAHALLEWDPGGRPGVPPHLELRFLAYVQGEGGLRPATLALDLDAPPLGRRPWRRPSPAPSGRAGVSPPGPSRRRGPTWSVNMRGFSGNSSPWPSTSARRPPTWAG